MFGALSFLADLKDCLGEVAKRSKVKFGDHIVWNEHPV
jgi:hypothetical protein